MPLPDHSLLLLFALSFIILSFNFLVKRSFFLSDTHIRLPVFSLLTNSFSVLFADWCSQDMPPDLPVFFQKPFPLPDGFPDSQTEFQSNSETEGFRFLSPAALSVPEKQPGFAVIQFIGRTKKTVRPCKRCFTSFTAQRFSFRYMDMDHFLPLIRLKLKSSKPE